MKLELCYRPSVLSQIHDFYFGRNSGQNFFYLIFEMSFLSLTCLTSRRSKLNKSFELVSNLTELQSFYRFLNFNSSGPVKSSNIYSNKPFKNITAVRAIFPVNTNRLLSFFTDNSHRGYQLTGNYVNPVITYHLLSVYKCLIYEKLFSL